MAAILFPKVSGVPAYILLTLYIGTELARN